MNIHSWRNGTAKIKASLTKDENPLRIGVISAAAINYAAIIDPVQTHTGAIIVAIAARSKAKAEAQITKYGLAPTCKAYGSYGEMLADPGIDAVYIPVPNGLHAEWAVKAMEAGKHVLIEKPVASNADQARRIHETATATGKVALEAFHWRFHPAAHRMREIVESGKYGSVTEISAEFGLPTGILGKDDIRFNYDLAGGASMDLAYVSCFCMYFAAPDSTACDFRVLEAKPRPNRLDNKIDDSMEAHFVIESPGRRPVNCHTFADSAVPLLWGFIPQIWKATPRSVIELEKARIEFDGFVLATYGHSIVVKEKDMNGRLTGKKHAESCYVDGPQWGTRGKSWWTTYRYQLEGFVDMVRANEAGREKEYHGPWMSLDESTKLMELIDAVYEKAGLPKRGL